MAVRKQPDVVDEAAVCSLERPQDDVGLTDAERAALDFADCFATDHLAIDDKTYNGLRAHYSEGELVELGIYCAYFVGFGRLTATWLVVDELPESFRAAPNGRTVTPWGHEDALDFRS